MASVNKTTIIGKLGRDPEIIATKSGTTMAKMSVATTEKWKDKASGEWKEATEWHRITAFGYQAQYIQKYGSKGMDVYIDGKLKTSSYEKDGITRYSTDIIANDVQFIGKSQKIVPDAQINGYNQNIGHQKQNSFNPGQNHNFDSYMGDSGFQPPQDQSDIPF